MSEKMTSGEIAKKAGISQKAVRLYDEKGLLKPTEYSEGNYRLYDNEALLVLEKIIALKQIGFSLEEIRDNIAGNKNTDILSTLQDQIELMEAKRYELERAIIRIKAVIARSNGQPDWDDVAEILKCMQHEQNCDDGHFFALDHSKDELDWYVKIFRSLKVKEGERVLDLGCGYSKVWRNNWDDIPCDVKVDGYDLPGSWADDFSQFVKDNSDKLADNTEINVIFKDVESEDAWEQIRSKGKYSMIIAHYLTDELKNSEALVARAASVLDKDGVMSLNVLGTIPEAHVKFWIALFEELGLDSKPLKEELDGLYAEKEAGKELLAKYFNRIDEIVIPCNFTYDKAEDLCKDLSSCLPGHKSFYENNLGKISRCLEKKLEEGAVKIPHDGSFWRLGV
ncbi:MAG: MerR family transcriptional regulator [Lachnospiraceae bacterium]|nr:MerR family transcriptional regulator [Lachnospiraceae bacterium]